MIEPGGILAGLPYGLGMGSGFAVTFALIRLATERINKREANIDASTQKLIVGLEKRLDAVTERLDVAEKSLAECQRKHAESEADVLRLNALLQGMGDARQQAALIVASEKRKEHDAA